MTSNALEAEISQFMDGLRKRNPHESEFHQAVEEVARSVMPYYLDHERLRKAQVLERLTEPDRIVTFRVVWEDDEGNVRVNRAWRVQFNRSLGPYKGGLRFHPTVTQSVLKFLGFEQIFKNSLTGLPMGGGKGGSNFNPKGKSEREVMRFCQSLMQELHHHIGADVDVPAGDIGVGGREISFLFGSYLRLQNKWSGVLTGKGVGQGGSLGRTEATGYGCVYLCEMMLEHHGHKMEGMNVAVSGAGNVALYAAEKAIHKGAHVVTLSDSKGFIYCKDGLSEEQLAYIKDLKEVRRGRISEAAEKFSNIDFHEGMRPWGVKCDVALPCATQNEIELGDAETLAANGVKAVCEGANMPSTIAAINHFHDKKVLFAPGKAANAGGVAVSGLEQSQNAMRISWTAEEVDKKLQEIMANIHARCVQNGQGEDLVDYVLGANLAGFQKVANAVLSYGLV